MGFFVLEFTTLPYTCPIAIDIFPIMPCLGLLPPPGPPLGIPERIPALLPLLPLPTPGNCANKGFVSKEIDKRRRLAEYRKNGVI